MPESRLQAPLPAGWAAYRDEGDIYYYNEETEESVWDHPGLVEGASGDVQGTDGVDGDGDVQMDDGSRANEPKLERVDDDIKKRLEMISILSAPDAIMEPSVTETLHKFLDVPGEQFMEETKEAVAAY